MHIFKKIRYPFLLCVLLLLVLCSCSNKTTAPVEEEPTEQPVEVSHVVEDADSERLTLYSSHPFTLQTNSRTKSWNGKMEYSIDGKTWQTWRGEEIFAELERTESASEPETTDPENPDAETPETPEDIEEPTEPIIVTYEDQEEKPKYYLYLRGKDNTKINDDELIDGSWIISSPTGDVVETEGKIESLLDYSKVTNNEEVSINEDSFVNVFPENTLLVLPEAVEKVIPTFTSQYSDMPYLLFSSDNDFILETVSMQSWDGLLEYSTDTKTWKTWLGETVESAKGEDDRSYLYLRGTDNRIITAPSISSTHRNQHFTIIGSDVSCVGNIEMLLDYRTAANGQHPVMYNGAFENLFKGCTALTTAPELPAIDLSDYCYRGMFFNCRSLTEAPVLPATTLNANCYEQMFLGCASLTTAPELPAEHLTECCYRQMFSHCDNLVNAPTLPATRMAPGCYSSMFYACTSLVTPPALPAHNLANECYKSMFDGCKSLTSTPSLPATTLAMSCYDHMFSSCSSLETASRLPALELMNDCYREMFAYCSSLKSAPALPAMKLAPSCYSGMFSYCTSLTSAPVLPALELNSFCYERMFANCTSLKNPPALPGETLIIYCYSEMFRDCTELSKAPDLRKDLIPEGESEDSYWPNIIAGCTKLVPEEPELDEVEKP